MTDIKTEEIEIAIAYKFGIRQNIIVPNISWGANIHECDIFIMKPSGYCVEVEIKRSKADLVADKKKGHGHRSKMIKELYFAIPTDCYDDWLSLIPDNAGILTYERWYDNVVTHYERLAPANKEARKLTENERLNIARLGCMRIWSLKKRLNH